MCCNLYRYWTSPSRPGELALDRNGNLVQKSKLDQCCNTTRPGFLSHHYRGTTLIVTFFICIWLFAVTVLFNTDYSVKTNPTQYNNNNDTVTMIRRAKIKLWKQDHGGWKATIKIRTPTIYIF